MSVEFTSVKCPECGASLPIEEGRSQVFCSYCGTKVIVTNDNEHIYRHIDEASIKRAETDRIVLMRKLELEEKRAAQGNEAKRIVTIIWLGLSTLILAICIIKWLSGGFDECFPMLFFLGGPIIGGGAYLIFKILPEKENEKLLLRNGGIRVPDNIGSFYDEHFEAAQSALRSAGFQNITCVNKHDLTIGLFQKPGKVDSISINGVKTTSGGAIYMPDTAIVITYHGK